MGEEILVRHSGKKKGERWLIHTKSFPVPFATHLVEDGLLITGQNPESAQAVIKRLQAV